MKIKSFIVHGVLVLFLLFSCSKESKNVFKVDQLTIDASFKGARLNLFEKTGDNSYKAHIYPAFEPVNKSPWFAFSITSKTTQEIQLKFYYKNYKHRYIPKLSYDKVHWKKIDANSINIDTVSGEATLKLKLENKTLFIAAQEIESSEDTYNWISKTIKETNFLSKDIVGKTVKNQSIYAVISENDTVKKSIVLIARQHPPEIPGGTIGFRSFFEELLADSPLAHKFRASYNMYTFPLLNPDGVDMGNWRHNANGVDLNRDWVDFSQPETQTARDFILNKVKEGKTINYAIDFHTSHSGPYMLVLDSINLKKVKGLTSRWIKGIEDNSKFKVEARKRSQVLPYCYNWFYNAFNTEAVTYEDGDEEDREIIKKRAKIYAQHFMKTMNLKIEKEL